MITYKLDLPINEIKDLLEYYEIKIKSLSFKILFTKEENTKELWGKLHKLEEIQKDIELILEDED